MSHAINIIFKLRLNKFTKIYKIPNWFEKKLKTWRALKSFKDWIHLKWRCEERTGPRGLAVQGTFRMVKTQVSPFLHKLWQRSAKEGTFPAAGKIMVPQTLPCSHSPSHWCWTQPRGSRSPVGWGPVVSGPSLVLQKQSAFPLVPPGVPHLQPEKTTPAKGGPPSRVPEEHRWRRHDPDLQAARKPGQPTEPRSKAATRPTHTPTTEITTADDHP